ncbi:hypothetical protein PR048_023153 [Dryococelus australis]|uniref:Uncharacterized protein n=1 Tax=Dryococelus australis TaxID=614101 RepID=A0ABQ9GTA9_9NEOP|nr:hypothetical protein PR048_023153 [Dryococelus australis]
MKLDMVKEKGAPDGIGDTCKRTADNLISQGQDISDIATLIIYGTNLDDRDDLNVTIKARHTIIDLNSIGRKESYQYYAVAKDIVREEDTRVDYLVRCSKEHDLSKGNPNSVDHKCSVSDII